MPTFTCAARPRCYVIGEKWFWDDYNTSGFGGITQVDGFYQFNPIDEVTTLLIIEGFSIKVTSASPLAHGYVVALNAASTTGAGGGAFLERRESAAKTFQQHMWTGLELPVELRRINATFRLFRIYIDPALEATDSMWISAWGRFNEQRATTTGMQPQPVSVEAYKWPLTRR